MWTYFTMLTLALAASSALAQDPGMQAAQLATQMAQQAAQQANDQMMQASQLANQTAMQNAQQASLNATQCYRCYAAKPKLSVKPGAYSAAITIKMKDSTRGAAIYYTTDGWTPTAASTRYTGPITIDSTTTLQAIAISPLGGRSRIATAVYTLNGVPAAAAVAQTPGAASNAASKETPKETPTEIPNSPAASSAPAKLLLAQGTAVPFVFASDVSSKTAEVGDKISLTLAADLKVGDVVVVKKGTPAVASVTEVDKTGMGGAPGDVFFQVDSLQAGGVSIKLHGSAAKEGQDHVGKAMGLMFVPVVPVGMFVHGKDAEIKQGAPFTAFVDADTFLPPAN
ncbi:MAG: chitobiase/beta-hexosaminidase C-terminal domain-containing protein [Terriglobales bacterium]